MITQDPAEAVSPAELSPPPEQVGTPRQMAREAIEGIPTYAPYIESVLVSAVDMLRGGDDEEGFIALARASDDLQSLLTLLQQIVSIVQPSSREAMARFEREIDAAVAGVMDSFADQDVVDLCDCVEGDLLPAISSWPAVVEELSQDPPDEGRSHG